MDQKTVSGGQAVSLPDVHRTVSIPRNVGFLKRLLAFAGPAYLVSVGYMDPGNWATDLEGGAKFGYQLLWVLLMSNLMAVLLQTLSARLGIVTGRDLAQACRDEYPRPVSLMLWILCEAAIVACDLAEVLGTAIGLNLLVGIPLLYGVIITGFDTLLFLAIQQFGIRKLEALIIVFVTTIGLCFAVEIALSGPVWSEVMGGFVPRLSADSLYIAVGILGATVMPHNLYLHSALVQSRDVDQTPQGRRVACRYNLIDSAIALNGAFFVNAAILIVAAAVFFKRGILVTEIQQAYQLLTPLLGTTLASGLFAIALISSGQSSTLTGTLAGQIVMEGFLSFKIRPVVRRLFTRLLAIVPAVIVIAISGDHGSFDLLIVSQVVLSLQLPFAVIPLIKFTSNPLLMHEFANRFWVKLLAWGSAAIIVALNADLIYTTLISWVPSEPGSQILFWLGVVPFVLGCAALLVYVWLPEPWRPRRKRELPVIPKVEIAPQRYARIGVALDYSGADAKVLSHAVTLARQHAAEVYLFHVVEGVSGQVYGRDAFDDEARQDRNRIEALAEQLGEAGITVHAVLGFGRAPSQLVALAKQAGIDLLVMGGHGHRGIKDFFFGASISEVRHQLAIPVLVVQ